MPVAFSDSLIVRYQQYMLRKHGLVIEPEQAQQDLERLAELHALFSLSTKGEVFPCPTAPSRRGGHGKADRRED